MTQALRAPTCPTPMQIIVRDVPPRTTWQLEQAGIHPLLARLFASRGVRQADELDDQAARLLPPSALRGATQAAHLLADALEAGQAMCIVADYDCDGATACAVAVRGLRMLGARNVTYLVPDRVVDGYGLTPPIAERVHQQGADVLITVDNGIASVDGVEAANALGLADRGRLQKGYLADFVLYQTNDYQQIIYQQGRLQPSEVWKNGQRIFNK